MNNQQLRKLDAECQFKVLGKRSFYSGKPAECYHHFIGRTNKVLRFDVRNLIPLTLEEHHEVHKGNIKLKDWGYEDLLMVLKNKHLKDELIKFGVTEKEYYKMKLREWD